MFHHRHLFNVTLWCRAGAGKPQAFGCWTKANKDHFADGAGFDQIYLKK